MAVDGTKAGGAHSHGAAPAGDKPKAEPKGAEPKVGERTPPRDAASAGEANVGARPARGGTSGATEARNGAYEGTGATGAGGANGADKAAGTHKAGGAHAHGAGAGEATMPGHEGHGHDSILYKVADSNPSRDQFIKGSLGADAGADFDLSKGAGFKGRVGRDPNGDDQKQNNLTEADANRPAYGIPNEVAGTGERPNYVQDIQVSIGMGGLEKLRPDVLERLIDNQNGGRGSVWNGVAYLTGLNDAHDGSVDADLEAQRTAIMNMPVGGSGRTLAQWAENPNDSRDDGRNDPDTNSDWARSNHAMTGIKAYLDLEARGVDPATANQFANNDDIISGAGRIDQIAPGRASNNQENTFTGMNNDERKEWSKAAATGNRDLLLTLMDSHTMGSHMLTQYGNDGAASKINESLGLDPNLDATARKAMIANYFLANPDIPSDRPGEDKGDGGGGGGGGAAAAGDGGAAAAGGGGGAGGAGDGAGDAYAGAEDAAGADPYGLLAPGGVDALLAPGVADPTLEQLLQEALLALQQSSPEVYQQLLAMAEQGIVDPAVAAAEIFGLFDDPAYAAQVDPAALQSAQAALAGQGIGRAGVDPRIPAIGGVAAGAVVVPGAPGAAVEGAGAGAAGLAQPTPTPAAAPMAAAAPAGAADGHAHAH